MFIRQFKNILFVGLLSILSIVLSSKTGVGQALRWIDGYKPYVDVGLNLRPVCNSNVVFTYVGGMVGLSIRNPEKRFWD